MKKSSSVVILRVVLAVVLLSLIFTCVYFFIIKARNEAELADNPIFIEYNTTLNSQNVLDINENLGDLESGAYYTYAESQGGLGYKEAYLSLYASQKFLDVNKDRLIISKGDTQTLSENLANIEVSATELMRSIILYNSTRDAYSDDLTPERQEALRHNFETMVTDLREYAVLNANLAHNVFEYTTASYYEGVNPFGSAKHMYNYCLDKQIAVYNSKMDSGAVPSEVYSETKDIVAKYIAVSEGNFIVQTTDANVAEVLGYFASGVNFDNLLNSEDKIAFVNAIADDASRAQAQSLLVALGLGEGV